MTMSSNDEARREQERLFVKVALKNSLVTEKQVSEAEAIQSKIAELGIRPKALGEVLLEREYITQEHFDRVMLHMEKLQRATTIQGYKLLQKLGQGSMGTVYKARQLSLDRVVAVKILLPFLQKNTKFVTRFLREAKVLARLNHPNIVQCIDVGVSNGLYYMAMEYCDGPTVLDVIKRGGRLAEERTVRIILQVTMALEHAFVHSILHRDIKPDNVMIVPGGTAKLCDLGLVKDLGSTGDTTDTGNTMGTPNYISPEQARGQADLDVRSDIYSLGASFYHMATGVTPFDASNPAVVMVAHINEIPPQPRDRCEDISSETNRIIVKMMRKNPDDRYQTPTELRKDLEKLLIKLGDGDDITGAGPVLRGRRRRRR